MKKYYICIIIFMFTLLSFSACKRGENKLNESINDQNSSTNSSILTEPTSYSANGSTPQSNNKTEIHSSTYITSSQSINKLDNKTNYNSLIKHKYSEDELFNYINPTPKTDKIITVTGFNLSVEMLAEKFPIECFRKMDDGRYYVIYKTKNDGLFYVFFKDFNGGKNYTHCFYWLPTLNENNYKDLKSANFSDIQNNDEIASRFNNNSPYVTINTIKPDDNHFTTLHPTKTGFIKVVYELCSGSINDLESIHNSTFNVHIERNSDFNCQYQGQNFNYSILSIDMPQ